MDRDEAKDLDELIASLDPASRTFFAEAAMGRDAKEFIQSDLGRYLIGCAVQEAQAAADKLKRVHPWRRRRITELQNEIWRAESFIGWLKDLVMQGKAAEVALDEREE